MLRPYMTTPRIFQLLRPAARPSAAVAVIPAPAPAPAAPTAPVRRRSSPAAVTTTRTTRTTRRTRSAPLTAAAPLRSGLPAVTIPASTPAPPLGLARRGRSAVGTIAAVAHRERRGPVAAVTLHRIALAHRRRVGAPTRGQRAIGDAEPGAHATDCGAGAGPVPEGDLEAGTRAHAVDEQAARAVVECVPAAVKQRIPVPVITVAEGPVEDGIVAAERIVVERIVAVAVVTVAIAVRPAPT